VLLSACSGQQAGTPAPVNESPENQARQQMHDAGQVSDEDVRDVNCSANGGGTVGPHQVDLIAVATEAGRVGCTEAFTVVTEYYENADKAEGTGRFLTVRGWNCGADTGAQGSGMIACEKDGLTFHTGPVDIGESTVDGPEPRFPNTTQTVQLTGYDTALDMVEFHLVRWAPGGPNNGHYVEVPGDTGMHRLPLACCEDRLPAALLDDAAPFAEIEVDGDNHIAAVTEIYTP
jgi:hypothetical protein